MSERRKRRIPWVALLAAVALGCETPPIPSAGDGQFALRYVRDSRTAQCFAFMFTGYHGGPALATVPCEAVPANLLHDMRP